MSSNYNETGIAGTTWIRSHQVQINNQYGKNPTVVFLEQRAVTLVDGTVLTLSLIPGFIEVAFDPSVQIPLINPWTGEPLTNVDGTQQYASHIEAYILLHSLYMQNAKLRDDALAAESSPPNDPAASPPIDPEASPPM